MTVEVKKIQDYTIFYFSSIFKKAIKHSVIIFYTHHISIHIKI